VLSELNRYRNAFGADSVIVAKELTTAANWFAAYMAQDYRIDEPPHIEVPGRANYTGTTIEDRIVAAGYTDLFQATEVLSFGDEPVQILRNLVSVPYHLADLLYERKSVGFGYNYLNVAGWKREQVLVVTLASKTSEASVIPVGEVRIFPCNGVTNIPRQSRVDETPQPIPGRNLRTNPIGTPIYVSTTTYAGVVLTLDSYSVAKASGGAPVQIAKVLDEFGADGSRPTLSSEKMILPQAPLDPDTVYRIVVHGAVNGTPFSKTCTFTTDK
jgi:hypothetical protein